MPEDEEEFAGKLYFLYKNRAGKYKKIKNKAAQSCNMISLEKNLMNKKGRAKITLPF